ncbi:transposase [Sinorhizobium meliloti]|uniref:transposase n=1 Tax=Rhizobium meliloti TaxID=382 RepID=UPI0023804FB3|nr:transposase [Sinorhizobium meliloti]MDE3759819.1 transposase [Sinorhizobium meliloti]
MIEAVAERLEGAPRQLRRRWSNELKAQAVAEALEPGASVPAIVHRIGIHPSQLFAWHRNARTDASPQRSAGAGASVRAAAAVVEIIIGDIVVRAGADVGEVHLQRVIRAVRSALSPPA